MEGAPSSSASSSTSSSVPSGALLACRECPPDAPKYLSVDELEIHITSDHLNFFPYECERCRFAKFPTLYALTTHCRGDHKLNEFYVRYKYSEENERKMAEAKTRLYLCIQDGVSVPQQNGGRFHSPYPPLMSFDGVEERKFAGVLSNGQVIKCDEEYATTSSPSSSTTDSKQQQQQPFDVSTALQDTSAAFALDGDQAELDFNSDHFTAADYQQLVGEAEQLMKKPKSIVTCQMCGLKVSNQRSSLVYHANTKHIKLNLYQCGICMKTWQTIAKSDVLKHVRAVHNSNESMIIDNRKRLCTQLRLFTQKCFPPSLTKPRGRPPGSGRGAHSGGVAEDAASAHGEDRESPENDIMDDMDNQDHMRSTSQALYDSIEAFAKKESVSNATDSDAPAVPVA